MYLPSAVHGQPPREAAANGGTPAREDLPWAYGCIHLEEFRKVTDGARTRVLRSHNPTTTVSKHCRTLQNRLV